MKHLKINSVSSSFNILDEYHITGLCLTEVLQIKLNLVKSSKMIVEGGKVHVRFLSLVGTYEQLSVQ